MGTPFSYSRPPLKAELPEKLTGKSSRGKSKSIQRASGEEPGLHLPFMIYFYGSQQARPTVPQAEGHCPTDPLRLAKQGPFKTFTRSCGGGRPGAVFTWAIWHDLFPNRQAFPPGNYTPKNLPCRKTLGSKAERCSRVFSEND